MRHRLWRLLDKLIKTETAEAVIDGQNIKIIRITAPFAWRCAAMVDEMMFTLSEPRHVYLNDFRVI
jgi:hypothetical protein